MSFPKDWRGKDGFSFRILKGTLYREGTRSFSSCKNTSFYLSVVVLFRDHFCEWIKGNQKGYVKGERVLADGVGFGGKRKQNSVKVLNRKR